MLPYIYGHFVIPKGYEGIRNEDLREEDRENFDLQTYCRLHPQYLASKCVEVN